MRRSDSILIIVSLLLLVTDSQQEARARPTVEASTNSCVHVGRLISVQGKVEHKRQEWSNYHPATVGVALCQGDQLRPAKGARAIVQCADLSQNPWTVVSSLSSGAAVGCRPSDEPAYTTTQPITPTRDPLNTRIPYIISPNRTWLVNNKPTLRWTAVPGATSYVVRVSGPGVNWVREVKNNSIIYSGEPSLRPVEQGYLLTVQADNGEPSAKAIFGLLDTHQATRVKTAQERITNQNLPAEAKILALVELYIGQELIAEATEQLETVAAGSQTAAIHYLLGDLYAQVELFPQALLSYQQAVKLAKITKDIEGQAMAAYRLGEVYTVLGNPDKAAYWLQQARQGHEVLQSLKPVSH